MSVSILGCVLPRSPCELLKVNPTRPENCSQREALLRLAQKVQKYAFFYFKQFSEIYICFEGKCLQYPAHVEIPYCGEILELEGFRRDNIKLHCLHLFDFLQCVCTNVATIGCICSNFLRCVVYLQNHPQIACLGEGLFRLVAFIPFLVTVCYQMFVQNAFTRGNKVALAAFV